MSHLKDLLTLAISCLAAAPAAAQTPVDWPALTQKPYTDTAVQDLGLRPLVERDGKQITTKDEWLKHRATLEQAWRDPLGPMPERPKSLDARVEDCEQVDGFERKLISFQSAGDDRIRAYLLIPGDLKQDAKRPAVVAFHQTTGETLKEPAGLGKNPTLALGAHLVKRGYIVLCPECYIMKDGGPGRQAEAVDKTWPGLTGLGKMTFDATRCVDYLESLPAVDAARIGCIGHSLGAKEVLFAMAFEPRYQAGVFNEGGIGLRMSNWTDPWYLTAKMKEPIPAMENHQVLALCAPRPILVLGGDSADGDASWPFVHAALPVYRLLGAGDRIGLVNHHGKHSFPRTAREPAYRWLDHWLRHTPTTEEAGP
jgi:dienelactone hydrolase